MLCLGAFVEVEPGVEGLVHVSEMSWSPRLHSAQEFLKLGDEVEAVILTLDREARKMSLGLKQLTQNPWESIREKYPVGSTHKATVRNITNFGVFAELEDIIVMEAFVHAPRYDKRSLLRQVESILYSFEWKNNAK